MNLALGSSFRLLRVKCHPDFASLIQATLAQVLRVITDSLILEENELVRDANLLLQLQGFANVPDPCKQ